MSFNLRRNIRGSLMRGVSLGAIALMALTPAMAQQAATSDDTLDTVVVTGTLLRGVAPVGTHMVDFSADDIKASGAVTTNQVLADIPQINSLFNTEPVTSTAGVGHDTQPKPVIRNLNSAGGAATLVMVDSHNLVGDGVLQTTPDPTSIPAMVLQRVDVLLDGGSSIYGSNAISGIINLITRKDFEGMQLQTQVGTTTGGDYNTLEVGGIFGHSWSSGGAYLAYEYRYNSYQYAADRPYPRQNLIPLGGTVNNTATNCALPNVTPKGGSSFALTTNTVPNTPGSLKLSGAAGTNRCDTTVLGSTPFPSDQQHSFFGSFHQNIADGIVFSMTANYSHHTTSSLQYADAGTGVITNANPYFQALGTETQQTVAFSLAPIYGNYIANSDLLDKFYVAPDLDVKLGGDWDLDILGNYERSSVVSLSPSFNGTQVNNDLATSDPNFAIDPYNLALSSANSLQQLQTFGTTAGSVQQLEQLRAIANGTVFSLPGGDVKLAVGAQYDYESVNAYDVNGAIGIKYGPTVPGGLNIAANVHRSVQSVFGEVNVPLVGEGNRMPFVYSLAADISARYDHYSDVGSTTNPKFGVTYEPISNLKLNGNIGTSFNAPSLEDKSGATDTRILLQNTPLGNVNPAFPNTNNYPGFLIAGGSPNLTSQKANTWSYGFDYRPDFLGLDGLDLSLTKWHVSIFNLIAQAPYKSTTLYTIPAYSAFYIMYPTLAQLNAATAGIVQAGFPGYAPYYSVAAGGTGAISNGVYALLDARRHNIGNVFDEGLDFNVSYVWATDWGTMDAGVAGSDYTKSSTQAYTGAPLVDQTLFNLSPYNFSAHVGGTMGPITARVTMNYSAGYSSNTAAPQTHVSAFMPVNLFINYDLSDTFNWTQNASIGLNINNLFDTNPPFINTGGGTANGSTLGRFLEVDLVKKF